MTTKWLGSIISRTAPTVSRNLRSEGGSASGIWTREQANYYNATSNWPTQNTLGSLYAWGINTYGQMADNTVTSRTTPLISDDGDPNYNTNGNYLKISKSLYNILAIKFDGTLWGWGRNEYSQLGTSDFNNKSSPVQIGTSNNWLIASAGYRHSLAVKTDGTLWACGLNNSGQIGTNDIKWSNYQFTQIGNNSNWVSVSAGRSTSFAIKTDGTLWSWGDNLYGALGDSTTVSKSSPVQIGALTSWLSVAAGYQTIAALKTDGTLWMWGNNDTYGPLGQNDLVRRSSPVQVGAAIIPTKMSAVSSSNLTTLLLRSDGKIMSWGANDYGQLGNSSTVALNYPKEIGASTHTAIFAGANFCLAIRTGGTLWAWGRNEVGQTGRNVATTVLISSPVQVGALTNWASLGGTQNSVAAIKTDGTLWTWGANANGYLAQNNTIYRSSPVQVGLLTNWSFVSSGDSYVMALKTNGTLWGWGSNFRGAIGINTSGIYRSSPVQIGTDTNWSSVAAGYLVTVATKTDGTLWAWGYNVDGVIGQSDTIDRSSPTQIGALTTWSSVAINVYHCLARKTDGTLWAWGRNSDGQLGKNDVISRSSPVQVGTDTNWSSVFTTNLAGTSHAVKNDNSLWGWGNNNNYGAVGDNTLISRSSPVQVGQSFKFTSVAVDNFAISGSVAAIKTDGTLWSWGLNTSGQVGDGTVINKSSPIQIGALTNWSKITHGSTGFAAIKTDGTLWAWGGNAVTYGALGDGTAINKSSPIQIGSDTNWSSIYGGNYNYQALKTNNTLWSWGYNLYGMLGKNDIISRSSPVQVGQLPFKNIGSSYYVVFGIKPDNTLWAWGYNQNGYIGDGTVTSRSSPVQVGALTTWASASGGFDFSVAIRTDYTLWVWGNNGFGQLGQNSVISRSSPTQVGVLTNWLKISAGGYHALAIKTDGTLWSWGRNTTYGTLGDGTAISKSSPIQIGALTNWLSVVANYQTSFAIKTDGTLWTWGYNSFGELGDSTVVSKSSPVQVGTLTDWKSLHTGFSFYYVMATKTDGTLWGWGRNSEGQLGDSTAVSKSSPVQVGTLTNWLTVTASRNGHTHANKTDGTLWGWGYNVDNSVGNGTGGLGINVSSPVQIGSLTNWIKVTSNYRGAIGLVGNFSSVITPQTWIPQSTGLYNLWAWGKNDYGQLGNNSVVGNSSPVQIGTDAWSSIYPSSSVNSYNPFQHTFAIKPDKSLWAWGSNYYGQLADNTAIDKSSPVQISSVINDDYTDMAFGTAYSLGVRTDGTLWGWGRNVEGQLGLGVVTNRSSPVQLGALNTWVSVSADTTTSAGVRTDGTLWTWGLGTSGQLGDGAVISRSSPVQVGPYTTFTNALGETAFGAGLTAAIKPDGTFWIWGTNTSGALGAGTAGATYRSSPVQLGALTNWYKVALMGAPSVAAIKTDGTLWTWGNSLGLGNSTAIPRSSPVQLGALTDWSKIYGCTCFFAIKTDGTLWTWGQNSSGCGGLGDTIYRSSPTQVGALTNWNFIAPGANFTFAIKTDSTVWAWGLNSSGQLGFNDKINRSSPTQIASDTNWSKIVGGGDYTLAVKTDGTLWAWGRNISGQLGFGDTIYRSSPVQVGALTNWLSLSVAYRCAIAVKTDGTLWAWGSNSYGQLGDNTVTDKLSPIQVGTNTSWLLSSLKSSGVSSNMASGAVKTDGTLWVWGRNYSGHIGVGDTNYRSSPTQIGSDTNWYAPQVIEVAATTNWSKVFVVGGATMFATKTDGTLWSWGVGTSGQHGNGTVLSRSSPAQIGALTNWSLISGTTATIKAIKTDGTLWSWGSGSSGVIGDGFTSSRSSPVQIGSDTNWSSVSTTGNGGHTALKTNGTIWSWGYNLNGESGLGDKIYRSSPVQVGTDTTWSKITSTSSAVYGIKTNGTLWIWGLNAQNLFGEPSLATTVSRSSPVQLGTNNDWSVFYGKNNSRTHIIIKKTDNTFWGWGLGTSGQFGDSTIISKSSPVQIGYVAWNSISSGYGYTLGTRTNGTLWSWGENSSGQLGQNDITNRSSPTQVGALTDWSSVYAGQYFSVAIKTTGTLWTWGLNSSGQLGQNNVINKSSPVQIGALTSWTTIALGKNFVVARGASQLYAWGSNSYGQLGDNTVISRSSPVFASSGSFLSLAAGNYHAIGIQTNGTLWTWGRNDYGQIGTNSLNFTANRSSPVQIGALNTWSTVTSSGNFSLAKKTDGTIWGWGQNSDGQLGLNNLINKSSPIQIGQGSWLTLAASYKNVLALQIKPIRNI